MVRDAIRDQGLTISDQRLTEVMKMLRPDNESTRTTPKSSYRVPSAATMKVRMYRRALGPEQTMAGLYPDNRRVRPTGRMVLYHLGELNLRIGNLTDPPTVQITRGVQLHLLELLGIEITQTRWPQT
ncbi:hypothetical protein ACIRRH_26830 [Kitasatospora sp. NPDC101235]|uniref:hypothetical protein n=1 Tax=Kitasatospora sp. NPDC101235 TaxID=3364101 RepID=UPI0037F8CCEC